MGATLQTGRVGFLAAMLASLALPVWSDAPKVTVSPAGIQDNAGSVAFRLRGGPDTVTDVTSGNGYLIYVEPALILDKSNIVLITLYVRSSATSSSPAYRYIFSEIPSGRFFDCKSSVGLSVQDGTTTETAIVTLPLHSSDPTIDFVASDDRAPAIPIDATSATSVDIGITNKLPDMDVVVTNVAVTMDHDEKWQSAAMSPLFDPSNPIRISPNHSLNLKVVVTPSFWKSVSNTVLPTAESQAEDTLRLKLSYASDNAGIPRPFEVTRSLRFVNWPGAVLFGLVGALLGSIVFYFGGKPSADLSLGRILLCRCSSAVILIGVGIFLVVNGSKFVLFNLNLDPRQLLAAFLVGGFAGVGLVDLVTFVRSLGKSNAPGVTG